MRLRIEPSNETNEEKSKNEAAKHRETEMRLRELREPVSFPPGDRRNQSWSPYSRSGASTGSSHTVLILPRCVGSVPSVALSEACFSLLCVLTCILSSQTARL